MGANVSSSSSLNDDFAATTPAGDSIFSKPLGSRTIFETPNKGVIIVSFVFDPKQRYTDGHVMASIITDYMQELRDGLTRYLLDPKDIVPKSKTLEETVWEQLLTSLPKDVLTKNLFSNQLTFDAYKEMFTANVAKTYHEEELLTRYLRERSFTYAFEVAIDAFPGDMNGKDTSKANGPKTGVLTFNIEGRPDGQLPPVVEEKEGEEEGSKTKKRKAEGEAKKSEKDQLLHDLNLTDFFSRAHVESVKPYPPTASQFFDAVGRWFSSVVSRRSAKLEKDQNRNHLYH